MNGIPILLADAVTAVLETSRRAAKLTALTAAERQALVIRRSYPDWDDDFKGLDTLAVDVVFVSSGTSGGDLVELDSEESLATDPAIDVAVRYRFETTDRDSTTGRLKNAPVDRLVRLVEEIAEQLAGERMQELSFDGLSANWLDTSVRTYCDYKRLREGIFLGVVRVRYNASKKAE